MSLTLCVIKRIQYNATTDLIEHHYTTSMLTLHSITTIRTHSACYLFLMILFRRIFHIWTRNVYELNKELLKILLFSCDNPLNASLIWWQKFDHSIAVAGNNIFALQVLNINCCDWIEIQENLEIFGQTGIKMKAITMANLVIPLEAYVLQCDDLTVPSSVKWPW